MPSDLNLATSQFDEDGFPIAVGFESDLELNPVSEPNNSDEASSPQETLLGYELVADMMRRQDEVLEQLDDLNARIELAIEQIAATRKSEIEALEAEEQLGDDDHAMDQPKAA